MNTLLAGLLMLATVGGGAAVAADCTDLAGQGTLCATVDPASGADVSLALEPQVPPVAARAAEPTCTDVAGQADVCHDIVADPASGVSADIVVDVHPTPPVRAAAAEPTCQDLAGLGHACVEADPASGVSVDVVVEA
jgi:hypothetical protein